MSVKKEIPCLSERYSFYEEISEHFFHKTDLDSCFWHNFFDIL